MGFFVLEGKMARGVESQTLGDLLDAHIGSGNQILRLGEADFQRVFLRAETRGLFEMPIQCEITDAELLRDHVDIKSSQQEFPRSEDDIAGF